ncbi:hypothetical protein [Aliamphritea spongicola]|nr:hypothetical protein [Aliamphritea spongicola]
MLHHIGVALGLTGLGAYYLIIDASGFLEWATSLVDEEYTGSALMVGIMVSMTPAFLLWKYYNRFLERRLAIKGIYYEDSFYKKEDDTEKVTDLFLNPDTKNTPEGVFLYCKTCKITDSPPGSDQQ